MEKTTQRRYNEMLEVLPPAYWDNEKKGFLVGEASDHKDGAPRYAGFIIIDGQEYETGLSTTEEFKYFLTLSDEEKLKDEQEPSHEETVKELDLLIMYDQEAIDAYIEARLGDLKDFEESYAGQYDNDEEFAMEMHEQTGETLPKEYQTCHITA